MVAPRFAPELHKVDDRSDAGFPVRLGLVHFAAFPESLAGIDAFKRTLELAVAGRPWDVLELSTEMPRGWTPAIRELIPSSVTIFLAGAPEMLRWPYGLNAASRQARRRAVDRTLALVDRAAEAGAENLMLTSGPIAGGTSSWGALLESLQRVCEYASHVSARPPNISIETFETVAIQRQYVGPTPLALWLMETVRREHPGFGITMDLAHLVQLGEDPAESLAAARGQVRHLQLSCCVLRPGDPRWGDRHPPFGTPGAHPTFPEASRALARWASTFDAVREETSPPVISMEVRPPLGEASLSVHKQCVRAAVRLCSRAGLRRASSIGEGTALASVEAGVLP